MNNTVMSYDVIHSLGCNLISLIDSMKFCVFWKLLVDLHCGG